MSIHHNDDHERQSLLRQVILQCQLDHLERCWNLDPNGNSLLDDELEVGFDELDDLEDLDEFDEDEFDEFDFPGFAWFDNGFFIPLDEETEDWIEEMMFRSLLDP